MATMNSERDDRYESLVTDRIEEAIFLAHHPSADPDVEVQYANPPTYMGQPRRSCARCQNAAAAVRIALQLDPPTTSDDRCPCGFPAGIRAARDPKGRVWCNVCCPGDHVWKA